MRVFFPAKADARTVNNSDVWFRPGAGGDQVVDIDTSFSDLLDNLDYGVSDIFIARKGSFSINLDLLFVGLNIVTPFIYIAITVTHTIIAILNIRSLFYINDLLQLSNTQTCY